MHFLQNGWGDLGAGIASLVLLAGGFLLRWRHLSRQREQGDSSISQPASEVRAAQDMLLRVIGQLPHREWLRQQNGEYYRITPSVEVWLIERAESAIWPPEPRSRLRVESLIVQPGRDYAPRFSVDVRVTEHGHIPLSVRALSAKFIVNGVQRGHTQAEASEIIEWMQALDEARPEE